MVVGNGNAGNGDAGNRDSGNGVQRKSPSEFIDWALDSQVGAGRFHTLYLALLGLAYGLPSAHTYEVMFASMLPERYDPPFGWHLRCGEGGCPRLAFPGDCSTTPLEDWAADESGRSIVADFQMICSQDYQIVLIGQLYFVGFGIGTLVFGQMSDRWGRKPAYLCSVVIMGVGGLLQASSLGWRGFALARAIIGFGVSGCIISSYVWLTEFLNPKLQHLMAWVPNVAFCMGQALVSPLAVGIHSWREYLLVANVFTVAALAYVPFMHESPRWLAMKGRSEQAHTVVRRMAACNGCPVPPASPAPSDRGDVAGAKDAEDAVEASLCTQLSHPVLALTFAVMCVGWFSIAFAFYGLGLFSPNLPLNAYVANLFGAAVAVPSYLVSQPLIVASWCGRRGAVAGGFLLGGAGLLASCVVRSPLWGMVLYFSSLSALNICFGVVYVWTAELFPTDVRGRAMSLCSLSGRVGAILAPFAVNLGTTHPHLALVIFALPCMASGVLVTRLPETRGRPLPQTLEDAVAAARNVSGKALGQLPLLA